MQLQLDSTFNIPNIQRNQTKLFMNIGRDYSKSVIAIKHTLKKARLI